jgi:TonB-dependent receptor
MHRPLAFLLALLLPLSGALPAAEPAKKSIDLPADAADRSLKRLSDQAGVEVVFATGVADGVRTNPVKGSYAPLEAARLLLAGTALAATQDRTTGALLVNRAAAALPNAEAARAESTPLARAAGSSVIRGTVRNAATAANLGQASVRLAGRAQEILTERDGTFALGALAAGTYEITASYVGLDAQTKTVSVGAGETARQDFELTSGIYRLDAFVVAGELEGNAAEINKVKKSDVFMNAISADALGTIPAGNIGEFLKYVPGLLIDYGAFPEAENVSMRGQDADATLFTFDGLPQASAGTVPRAADSATTAFNFRDISIDNIEAIEVYKAPPAWMSPSTGGVINAVRKNAFAQKGRRLTLTGSLNGNSQWLGDGKISGPGPGSTRAIRPGFRLNYSEAFLNNTLGVALTLGVANTMDPRHNYLMTYARIDGATGAALAANPTTDATPMRFSQNSIVNTTNRKDSRSAGLDLDYRLGERTVLKFNASHTNWLMKAFNNRINLTGGTIAAGSTAEDTTGSNVSPNLVGDNNTIENDTLAFAGRIEHRVGDWRLDAAASWSEASAENRMLPDHVTSTRFVLNGGATLRFRTHPGDAFSRIEQLAGTDIYHPANYVFASGGAANTTGRINDMPRRQDDTQWHLAANARRDLPALRVPLELRAGLSYSRLERAKRSPRSEYDYIGPDGRYRSGDERLTLEPFAWTNGPAAPYVRTAPRFDIYKLAAFYNANRSQFADLDGLNVRNELQGRQNFAQHITAAYFSASARPTARLTLIGGVRAEETEFLGRGPLLDPTLAAGLGLRDNPAALNQLDNPAYWRAALARTQRAESTYRNAFPNWQASYRFTPDLVFRGALTRSMKRPNLQNLLPNTTVTVNETTGQGRVSIANTALQPAFSNNLDLGLELFTRPSGTLSLGYFEKKIAGYILTDESIVPDGPGNGFNGDYAGYDLITQENGGSGRFAGWELAGRQQLAPWLKFMPDYARNFGVFFSYTRNTRAAITDLAGDSVTPTAPSYFDWFASYGVSYETARRQFYVEARATVFPRSLSTRPTATDRRGTYIAATEKWDLTARYRFSRRYALEFNVRNLTAEKGRTQITGRQVTRWDFYDTFYALSFTANLGDR